MAMDSRAAQESEGESFAGLLLRHRGRTGLSQRDLAERVGTTRRSIQDWESGAYYPSAERLQSLIRVLLASGGLTAGREQQEANELWTAVLREAPRMRTPLDQVWLDGLSAQRTASEIQGNRLMNAPEAASIGRSQDWGEAPDVVGFVGRAEELATLREWVLKEHCRLAAVLGMGGIGKTALASRLAQDAVPSFQRVYWRSLRDALPAREWLAGAIGFLSGHHLAPPSSESARVTMLLQLLRDQASLLVLDNFETVLQPGQQEAFYRDGFAGYGVLLRAIGETRHQSCLVLTSREAPPELAELAGGGARRFQLGGLGVAEGQVLLTDKQLSGTDEEWAKLIGHFGGNGLALKVVGESIRQVFDGDIGAFLDQTGSSAMLGGMRRLLSEQIERSSALEQRLLRVLAVEREPVSLAELIADMGPRVREAAVLGAVEALRRRSLVERPATRGRTAFTLQSVVLEYVTDRLVEEVGDEIARGQPLQLVEQFLIKAQAKDYVRQTQERLIGEPVLHRLTAQHGDDGSERRLLALLDGWRNRPEAEQGYGPGNVVNLLRLRRGDLRNLDLGHLVLRQAHLAGVGAQDASLAGAHLSEAVLADAFNFPICVALSGDGASLLTGTATGEVWLWRLADRTPLLAVQGHAGPVHGVALSADGQLVATAGEDGVVRLWEVSSARLLATLQGHTGGVWGVALSPDGRLLASGGEDETVQLWMAPLAESEAAEPSAGRTGDSGRLPDASPGGWALLATLKGHTGGVWGVALSAQGRLLAVGSQDGTVRLWEASLADGEGDEPSAGRTADSERPSSATRSRWGLLATLQGHTGGVWGVALSADGRLLASGSSDGTVRLWQARTGRQLATLRGPTSPVYGLALSADGRLVASGSQQGTVQLWEATTGVLLATMQGHTGQVYSVALSPDGRLLASSSEDGTVRLWEALSGRLLATLQGHNSGILDVALSADGQLLASGDLGGTVQLWEARFAGHEGRESFAGRGPDSPGVPPSGARLLAALRGHTSGIRRVALSADGRLLASGSADGVVRLWEPPSGGRLVAALEGHTGGVWSVTLSADGRLVASGSADGVVRLWEASNGRLLTTFQAHTGPVYSLALSPDGLLLASSSQDATVRLWEASTGLLLATLQGHTGPVWGVALSPDGRLLASGGLDGTVRLWEAPFTKLGGHESFAGRKADSGNSVHVPRSSGGLLATLLGHTGAVLGVALSADGQLLASGGLDGTVRLWEVPSGRGLATLHGHTSAVWGVTLSSDGRLLASGGLDGTVRLWDAITGKWLHSLRSDRCYERMDITGVTGVTAAQRKALLTLGALDREVVPAT